MFAKAATSFGGDRPRLGQNLAATVLIRELSQGTEPRSPEEGVTRDGDTGQRVRREQVREQQEAAEEGRLSGFLTRTQKSEGGVTYRSNQGTFQTEEGPY